jgi:hypothetical protein
MFKSLSSAFATPCCFTAASSSYVLLPICVITIQKDDLSYINLPLDLLSDGETDR